MPHKVCSSCRHRPATYRGRCAECARKWNATTHRTGRLKPTSGRFYDSKRWQILRARRLSLEPLCRTCHQEGTDAIATQVDHITPVEDGGKPYSLANTQSLCATHHSSKTMQELRSRRG